MKKLLRISLAIALPVLMISLNGCKKDAVPRIPPVIKVKLENSKTLGNYLEDKDGKSLYYFSNDFAGQNTCTGGCAAVWPVFFADSLLAENLGTGLDIADFATITTTTGQKQLTYKTWPLYYYAPSVGGTNTQEAPGLTTGEAVGGIWFVAKPDYSIMLVNAQLVGHDGKNYKSDYTEGTGKTIYFSDAKGVTLYAFSNDKSNKNNFTKPDFSNNAVWPIYETDKVVVPSVLNPALFGSIDVFGKKQLTYKGWPLYHFGQDGGLRGLNKGISFPSPGIWPVPFKDIAAAPL